jgi:hypothetical protein
MKCKKPNETAVYYEEDILTYIKELYSGYNGLYFG